MMAATAKGAVPSQSNRYKLRVGLIAALMVLLMVIVLSLTLGAKHIPLDVVWQSLDGQRLTPDHVIIIDARIPRTLAGILCGAALGVAGALIQGLTRNPLADPGILGVNAGASFAVVIGISMFGAVAIEQYLWFAFAGALLASVAVYFVGTMGPGRINPIRLTLAGVALGAVLTGISSAISLLDPMVYDKVRFWEAGSLDIRNLGIVLTVTLPIIAGCAIALLLARSLNAMTMGEELAAALGTRVLVTQLWGVLAITLLCGAATAAVGPIGFVGLMVPHIARGIVGPDQRWIIPYTIVLTPILLLLSDILGRVIVPGELRVSVVTAFVGAPVLIWLVRQKKAVSGL